MTTQYLSARDYADDGGDLIDVVQRGALHAVAPHLQDLQAQNAHLQTQLAREARARLDMRVEAAVPDFRSIDEDPRWLNWLAQPDPLSGVPRQQLLNRAIADSDAARTISFFRQFQREAGATPHASSSIGRTRSTPLGRIYTRAEIQKLFEAHRRGAYNGREAAWQEQERDILAAAKEGRIHNPMALDGK